MTQKTNRLKAKRPTITEIATQAGVSVPTVSRVLNSHPDVAPDTRARVEGVLRTSGFVRSRSKNTLRKKSIGIVELVLPDLFTTFYHVEIARGIGEVLERTEFRLAISTTGNSLQGEQRWLTNVSPETTDGVLLVLPYNHNNELEVLHQRNIPFVVVDHHGDLGTDIPSVGATNWTGGRTATEYLLSLGHRRIAMISGHADMRCSLDRIAGYQAALLSAGITPNPAYIRQGDFSQQAGYEQTCQLLDLPEPPTAIFAGCDMQAMGAYSALHARGVSIPDEMSVIGFDDLPIASIVTPGLTSIRQPLMEMGRVATTMLLRLLENEPLDSMRMELTTTLVTRQSCARRASDNN